MTLYYSAMDLLLADPPMAVHPLKPGTKVPATLNGFKDATTDPAALLAWSKENPDYNYGVACGMSGLYVIDVDEGPGKNGAATWAALVAEHGHVETFTVRTQSGGRHFYYRMPPGQDLRNSKLGEHIDTRGNGYTVAPGSIVNDRPYVIETDVPIADLPQWVVEAVTRQPLSLAPAGAPADAGTVLQRVQALAAELAATPEGEGNDKASSTAFMVGQYVGAGQLTFSEAESALYAAIEPWTFKDEASRDAMYNTIARQLERGAEIPRAWVAALDFDATYPDSLFWRTDLGQADWILATSPGIKNVAGVGYLVWAGKLWNIVDEDSIRAHIQGVYREHCERSKDEWGADPSNKVAESVYKFFLKQCENPRLNRVASSLRSACYVRPDEGRIDAHPHLLNTPNGVVDMRTGEIGPHDPDLLLTKITSGNYRPGYTHPDWIQASNALTPEVWDYMQLRMGAALVADSRPDTMVILYGANGRNGKSCLGDDGVLPAIGDYGFLASAVLLAGGKGKDGDATPEKAALRGHRFVFIEELEEGAPFSSNELKRLIDSGTLNARGMYKDSSAFEATHSLFVTTNHQPGISETTDALWRRLMLVQFDHVFVDNPTRPEHKQGDAGLKNRLRAGEDGQHDAVVTWLVEGARRFYADKKNNVYSILNGREPAKVARDTENWRKSTDRVLGYAEARIVRDPDAVMALVDLSADVNHWLTENNYSAWSSRTVRDRVLRHSWFGGGRLLLDGTRKTAKTEGIERPAWFNGLAGPLPTQPEVITGYRFRRAGE